MSVRPISRKRVKYTAKKQLAGQMKAAWRANWIEILLSLLQIWTFWGLLAYAILNQVMLQPSGSSPISTIISQTIFLVLTWSARWAIMDWLQAPNQPITFRHAYQGFWPKRTFSSLMLALVTRILIFLWTICLLLPGLIKRFSYSQTYYAYKLDLLFDRQQKQLTDYLTISRRVMAGRKMELFQLDLSLLGWRLLGWLTFGLANFYVIPYYNTCQVVYSSQVFAQALGAGEK
ncbi:DUF975 family protein [Leuconostocaceae bacterium ESL0958]|nr:DUF975 family protein [Leuconostocaceae bacterium ESL0958]